jgi:hypothetical protein
MRKLIYILFALVSLVANAQSKKSDPSLPRNPKTGSIEYVDSASVRLTKNEIFNKANEWISTSYNSSKAITQLSNSETGRIILKPTIPVYSIGSSIGHVNYTFIITCKDSVYTCSITNLIHENFRYPGCGPLENEKTGSMNYTKGQWHKIKKDSEETILALMASLKEHLTK